MATERLLETEDDNVIKGMLIYCPHFPLSVCWNILKSARAFQSSRDFLEEKGLNNEINFIAIPEVVLRN